MSRPPHGAPSPDDPPPSDPPLGDRIRGALREAWQLLRGFAGERAYEDYLAHQAEHHPGEPVLDERAFWRRHVDRGDRQPTARCC